MKKTSALSRLFGLILFMGGSVLSSCSSTPESSKTGPNWIHLPARTMDAGYVVYITSAEDRTLERAIFKAKAAAIEDIANECSFAPKGTRIEDQFETTTGILHTVYIKMGLSFEDCQTAQKTIDPEAIQKLANSALAQELKRYQDEVDLEAKGALAQNTPNPNASPGVIIVAQNPTYVQYFGMRQQMAYAKEVVILAPPGSYVSNSPSSTQFTNSIQPGIIRIREFESANPQTSTWNHSWSSLPYKPPVAALSGINGMRTSVERYPHVSHALENRSTSSTKRKSQPQQGRSRRRRYRF